MISMRLIPIITLILLLQPCIFGKMTRFSIPQGQMFNKLFVIVHSHVCGSLNIKTHGQISIKKNLKKNSWTNIFYIHDMDTYFKPKRYENFQKYKKEVKNQLGKNIKILR